MDIRRSRLWIVAPLALVGLLVQVLPVGSQCNTAYTQGTTGIPAYYYVNKTATNANTCTLTMFMNVFACFPGGQFPPVTGVTGMGTMLQASAFTAATNPSCGWACDCGAVTVNSNDGLPVELMDFSVE